MAAKPAAVDILPSMRSIAVKLLLIAQEVDHRVPGAFCGLAVHTVLTSEAYKDKLANLRKPSTELSKCAVELPTNRLTIL